MARPVLYERVVQSSGQAVPGATVWVYEVGTTTPVTGLYSQAVGGVAATQPFITDDRGAIQVWIDTAPKSVDLAISHVGGMFESGEIAIKSSVPFLPANIFDADSTQSIANKTLTAYTLAGDVKVSPDATYDVGPSGAFRPRDINLSRDLAVGRNAAIVGTLSVTGILNKASLPATGRVIEDAGAIAPLINQAFGNGVRERLTATMSGVAADEAPGAWTRTAVDTRSMTSAATGSNGFASSFSVQTQYQRVSNNHAAHYMMGGEAYSQENRQFAWDGVAVFGLSQTMTDAHAADVTTHSNMRARGGYFEGVLGSRHANAYAGGAEVTGKNAAGQALTAFAGSLDRKVYALAVEGGSQLYDTGDPTSALGTYVPLGILMRGGQTIPNGGTPFLTGIYFDADSYADYGIDFKPAGKSYVVASGAWLETVSPGTIGVKSPIRIARETYIVSDAGGTDSKMLGVNSSNQLGVRNDSRVNVENTDGSVIYAYFNSAGITTGGAVSASGLVSGNGGSFSGAVSGTTGTFSGAVSGAGASFTGDLSATGFTWTTWTPTLAQNGARTLTIQYARYRTLGKTAWVQVQLTCTNAGTAGNAVVIGGFPAAIQSARTGNEALAGMMFWNSAGTRYQGAAVFASAATIQGWTNASASPMGGVPNLALANGDILSLELSYEIA